MDVRCDYTASGLAVAGLGVELGRVKSRIQVKDKDSVDAADLPEPDVLAKEAKKELKAALDELDQLLVALEGAE